MRVTKGGRKPYIKYYDRGTAQISNAGFPRPSSKGPLGALTSENAGDRSNRNYGLGFSTGRGGPSTPEIEKTAEPPPPGSVSPLEVLGDETFESTEANNPAHESRRLDSKRPPKPPTWCNRVFPSVLKSTARHMA